MNEQENETRTCSDCGAEFAFSAEERRFFEERGLTPPKRCRACRRARKAERSFAPGGRGPSAGGGDRPSGGGGDRPSGGERPMGWGPRRDEGFRGPSGYGRGGGEGGESRPRFDDRRGGRPRDRGPRVDRRDSGNAAPRPPNAEPAAPRPRKERPKYDIVCQQCGAAAQVPFKPIEGRQLFCKPCYDARKNAAPKEGAETSAPAATTAVPEE